VREAIAAVPDSAWVGAIGQDGVPVAEHPTRPRKAYVTELTEHLDLSAWPQGSRLICRRERAHPGAQLSLVDTDGRRHTCFLTDRKGDDLAALDRDHRAHAHVEQRIEDSKALGLAKLPFRSFGQLPLGSLSQPVQATNSEPESSVAITSTSVPSAYSPCGPKAVPRNRLGSTPAAV